MTSLQIALAFPALLAAFTPSGPAGAVSKLAMTVSLNVTGECAVSAGDPRQGLPTRVACSGGGRPGAARPAIAVRPATSTTQALTTLTY